MRLTLARVFDSLGGRSFRSLSRRGQRWLLALAVAVFLVGGLFAVWELDLDLSQVRWGFIAAVALVGVPLTAVVNAVEYGLSARIVGARVRAIEGLRVSVLSTAANLLPLPGGPLVRVQALHRLGPAYRGAISSTALLGLVWIGVAAGASGVMLIASNAVASTVFLTVGAGCLGLGTLLLARLQPTGRRASFMAAALAVEVALVAASALRLLLVLRGLGVESSLRDGFVLALAGVVAAAVGVFPGGLGLREAVSALLAPLVGLAPIIGFAVTAFDRVIGIVLYAPITIAVMLGREEPLADEGLSVRDVGDR